MSRRPASPIIPMPLWLLAVLLVGAPLALTGGLWDDAWHTERGRDTFWTAPHLVLYAGITMAGAALGLWALLAVRRHGRRALRYGPRAMALLGVSVTLGSAPVDALWHEAFGRDSVFWSPPHLLGIIGTSGLAVALLAELRLGTYPAKRLLMPVAGGLVLAGFAFLVVEYDTDVPQFDEAWYLPVLSLTSAFALGLVRRLVDQRWAMTLAALAHLAFIAALSLFLLAVGFEAPKLPLVVVAAAALDAAGPRRLSSIAEGTLYAVILHLAYVPTLNLLGDGVRLDAGDLLVSLPLSVAAASAGLALAGGRLPLGRRRQAVAAATTALLVLGLPGAAFAHDPGQGEAAGTMGLSVAAQEQRIRLAAVPEGHCDDTTAGQLIARRAGETVRTAMRPAGHCRFTGAVTVPDSGRWFVYAQLERHGQTVEAWLPVKAGSSDRASDPARYAYVSEPDDGAGVVQVAVSIALYGLVLAFLLGIVRLAGRASRLRPA